jgi:hypothetical protein
VAPSELEQAASHVAYEWTSLAGMAVELAKIQGARTLIQNALLEAFLVHDRCLINFLCGGYTGARDPKDLQPKDLLGREWWPPDEEFDRRLRGRLPVINQNLAHLSWQRVRSEEPVSWQALFIAHETSWGMGLFVDEVVSSGGPCRGASNPASAGAGLADRGRAGPRTEAAGR